MEAIVDFTYKADELFNDSFYDIRRAKTRFVVIYGGSGSGKSVSVHQSELINMLTADAHTLFIRKHASDLLGSCWALMEEQADRFNISELFTWTFSNSKRQIENKATSKKIIMRGLDDPEKIKSIVGIKRIVIEEASQLDFKDFRELNRRARGIPGIQIILILNPIDENHWIKKHFVDSDGAYHKDTTILKYLYNANKFLTEDDIAQLELLQVIDPVDYDIYVLAKWGIRDNKRAWLYNYDKNKHGAQPVAFLPSFPVYLSFDFNNDPFACVAFQFSPRLGFQDSFIHVIKEFSGSWKLEEMCQRIRATYPASILYVTGDRSGSNEDIGRNQTLYGMIQAQLRLNDKQMNTNTSNLEHADSRFLCNAMFGAYPNLRINARECPNLVSQCLNAKTNPKSKKPGELLKDREDHKNDEFDAMRYFFQTYFLKFAKENYFRFLNKQKPPNEAA